jgi:hypothetical protein
MVNIDPNMMTIHATDVTGQRRVTLEIDRRSTVDDLIRGSNNRMHVAVEDADDRRVTWFARDDKRGVALRPSQVVGEALHDQDTVRIQPEVSAGCR